MSIPSKFMMFLSLNSFVTSIKNNRYYKELYPQDNCESISVVPPSCPADRLEFAQNDCEQIKTYDSECWDIESHYNTCVSSVCNCPEEKSPTECACSSLASFFASKCHSDIHWLPESVCSDQCECGDVLNSINLTFCFVCVFKIILYHVAIPTDVSLRNRAAGLQRMT